MEEILFSAGFSQRIWCFNSCFHGPNQTKQSSHYNPKLLHSFQILKAGCSGWRTRCSSQTGQDVRGRRRCDLLSAWTSAGPKIRAGGRRGYGAELAAVQHFSKFRSDLVSSDSSLSCKYVTKQTQSLSIDNNWRARLQLEGYDSDDDKEINLNYLYHPYIVCSCSYLKPEMLTCVDSFESGPKLLVHCSLSTKVNNYFFMHSFVFNKRFVI